MNLFGHPGAQPHTPSRIEWLLIRLQAAMRQSLTNETKFLIDFTAFDPETILIMVRYYPTVDREAMNITLDTARKVVHINASSYGWNWVKVKEDVQMISQKE